MTKGTSGRGAKMKKDITIIDFVTDPKLLGLSISQPQETLLKAIYGLPLTKHQLDIYRACTGRQAYSRKGFGEATVLAGARSGKDSRIACPIAAFEACFGGHEKKLGRGEKGIIPLVAQDTRGTRIAFEYLRTYFTESALLKSMLDDEPYANEIRLNNRITIMCFPSTQSSLRGWSIPVAVLDEVGFWRLEGSADSDVEIQSSVRRGMIAFANTRLIKISSPYMKSGVLYDDYKNHYGQDSPDLLVWKASSIVMNPKLTDSKMEAQRRLDPSRYQREYEAEFAEGLESFLPSAWVEQSIILNRYELPFVASKAYSAGVDATGLGGNPNANSFTLVVGHYEKEVFVQDVCKGWKKSSYHNVDLEGIVGEIADILKRYNLREVHGDRYSGQWVVENFRKVGITYKQTEQDKSVFYLELEPLFAQGRIEILDHPELARELRLLDRRPRPGGKMIVDHPRGSHDDHANSLAIAVAFAKRAITTRGFPIGVGQNEFFDSSKNRAMNQPFPSSFGGDELPEEINSDPFSRENRKQGISETYRLEIPCLTGAQFRESLAKKRQR
jgi:hypothetical protein